MARTRNQAGSLLTLGLLGVGGYLAYRMFFAKRRLGPVRPPRPMPPVPTPDPTEPIVIPDPPPPGITPTFPYEAGGETVMQLGSGQEFVVTYDPLSPFDYVAQDTETVQAIDSEEGTIRFHVAAQMPEGGVDQVYVQAVDENGDLLGEHKISVLGP